MYYLQIEKQDYTKYSLVTHLPEYIVSGEIIHLTDPNKIIGLFDGQPVGNINLLTNEFTPREPIIFPKKIIGELELYSKYSFKPNKRGVPAYLFTPIDKRYPKCIVHSKVKRKYTTNVLATVDYTNWEKNNKFASANINNIFGEINDLEAIQESILLKYNLPIYNLKCNFKHIPLLFNSLLENVIDREFIKKDIISIDPDGCRDIDDALSIYKNTGVTIVDIHIADVYYVLSELGILPLVKNVTSIYLDEYIKHMLPTIISSEYGSLIEKNTRFMLSLEVRYCSENNKILSTRLRKTYGVITKNYSYDNYPKRYFKYAKTIEQIYKLITHEKIVINDSHKLIEAIMIIYNTEFCNILNKDNKQPVYRIQENTNITTTDIEDNQLSHFLSIIKSRCAKYSYTKEEHATLKIDNYTHATSPLRRIVDLINQEIFYTGAKDICNNFSKIAKTCEHSDKTNNILTLNYINNYNQSLKKAYRDINKLVLAHKIYTTAEYTSQCYIYDIDIDTNKLFLYFPDENLSIKTSIIHNKINHMYNIKLNNRTVTISDCEKIISEFTLNTLEEIKINGKPNIHYPDKSIIINFKNIILE
jgi:exoribonuclease R